MVNLQLWSSEENEDNSSLLLHSDPLLSGVVVPIRIKFIGQMNMFEIIFEIILNYIRFVLFPFGLNLWNINRGWLFNAKSCFYMNIKHDL